MKDQNINQPKYYQPGDRCYVVENHSRIAEAIVVKRSGNLYTLRMGAAAIRLPAGRLYPSREEAMASLPESLRIKRHNNRPPMLH